MKVFAAFHSRIHSWSVSGTKQSAAFGPTGILVVFLYLFIPLCTAKFKCWKP